MAEDLQEIFPSVPFFSTHTISPFEFGSKRADSFDPFHLVSEANFASRCGISSSTGTPAWQ